jgi:hypothetical protein
LWKNKAGENLEEKQGREKSIRKNNTRRKPWEKKKKAGRQP